MGKNKLNNRNAETKQQQQQMVQAKTDISQLLEEETQPIIDIYDTKDDSLSVYLWLLVFSVLMFTFPFLTFYAVRSWLNESFEFTNFQTNCFSVLASVLVVNFIVCLYVFKAFREEFPTNSSSSRTTQTQQVNAAAIADNKKSN